MDRRITFGDIKKIIQSVQEHWEADDKVVVIRDQHVADILQELLDEMAVEESVDEPEPYEMQAGFDADMERLNALSINPIAYIDVGDGR